MSNYPKQLRTMLLNDEMENLIAYLEAHPDIDLNDYEYGPFTDATDLPDQKTFQSIEEEALYLEEKSIRLLQMLEKYGYRITRLSDVVFLELASQIDLHYYGLWPCASDPYLGVTEYLLKKGCDPNSIVGKATALDLVIKFDYSPPIDLLRRYGAKTYQELMEEKNHDKNL